MSCNATSRPRNRRPRPQLPAVRPRPPAVAAASAAAPARRPSPPSRPSGRAVWLLAPAAALPSIGRRARRARCRERSICCARASVSRWSRGPLNPSSVRDAVIPPPLPAANLPPAPAKPCGLRSGKSPDARARHILALRRPARRPDRRCRPCPAAQSAGRGTSRNRSAGQRPRVARSPRRGVSPRVKNP